MNKALKLPAYLSLWIIGAFISGIAFFKPLNKSLIEHSARQISIFLGLSLFVFALLYLTAKLVKQPEQAQRLWQFFINSNRFYFLFFLLGFTTTILLLLPPYRLGDIFSYIFRLRPILIWLSINAGATIYIFVVERTTTSLKSIIAKNQLALKIGTIAFGIFILICGLIALTGIGIQRPEDYWYGAGAPILGIQTLLALGIGGLFLNVETNAAPKKSAQLEIGICIMLFIFTAVLWIREPARANFFMPDTAKNALYPYSDSATFDIGSQFALIGQGLFNGAYFDRALYSSFLIYLHNFAGQDLEKILNLQVVLYSIFPIIIYLIGKELHSRSLGISAAVLASLRGANSITVAAWVDLASPKMLLTDFPTAIGVALFLLFAIKWFKNSSRLTFAILAGGALGLTLMLRTHVLLLFPALAIFTILLKSRLTWKRIIFGILLASLGMVAATTPWDLRNLKNGNPMFYVYYYRIQTILEQRYQNQESSGHSSNLVEEKSHKKVNSNSPAIHTLQLFSEETPICNPEKQACKIANHFFHNLISSFLFLPTSLTFDDLWNTVKVISPYWQAGWTGTGLNIQLATFILINLFCVALGIGTAWEKKRWIGIFPLWVFLIYIGANALGLTSSGRYIVPVDWIVCFYYILGLFQIMLWLLRLANLLPNMDDFQSASQRTPSPQSKPTHLFLSILLIFLLGSTIPLSELPFKQRYKVKEPNALLTELSKAGVIERAGFSYNELADFLAASKAKIIEGRALYPRYYKAGSGEPDTSAYYLPLDYSRLVFTLISPYAINAQGIVVASQQPPNFTMQAVDVIVIGCENTEHYAPFIDALVVFTATDAGYVYLKSPEQRLSCTE